MLMLKTMTLALTLAWSSMGAVDRPVTFASLSAPAESVMAAWFAEPVVWAGHQVVTGEKKVPVLGTLQTRVDTYTLASVRRSGEGFVVEQTACKVNFKKVAGTKIAMKTSRLPRTKMRFVFEGGADEVVGGSVVEWGKEDVDRDGNPGFAVKVDAPMCGGTLHVANSSKTRARGTINGADGMRGTVDVVTDQTVLGADGRCLERLAKDSSERQKGKFAYTRVDAGATCKSLLGQSWPVKAG